MSVKLPRFLANSYRLSSTNNSVNLRSSLVVVGPQGKLVSKTVIPEIDIKNAKQFGAENVRQNLQSRNTTEEWLLSEKTVEDVLLEFSYFKQLSKEVQELELERTPLKEQLKKNPNDQELMKRMTDIKRELRAKNELLWKYEEESMIDLLKFPNVLDPRSPKKKDKQIYIANESAKTEKNTSGIDEEVEFEANNVANVFLRGSKSKMEMDLLRNAQFFLQKDDLCDILTPPDIVRTVIIEGCDPQAFGNPQRSFVLGESSDFGDLNSGIGAHLVGAASFPAMASFFVKNVLMKPSVLPLHYFSIGRQYKPRKSPSKNLSKTQQSSCVGLLSLNDSPESLDQSFELFVEKVKTFYDQFGLPFQLIYKRSSRLTFSESLRLEVLMWSPYEKNYIRVAWLSNYGDYVSRRLLLKYSDQDKNLRHYHLLFGTFIDTFRVISCMK